MFLLFKFKDPSSLTAFKDDPVCKEFLENSEAMKTVDNTTAITSVDPAKFDVIFCVGGHGPMFDLPNDEAVNKAVATVYEKGGIAAAVCHGPAGKCKFYGTALLSLCVEKFSLSSKISE